MDNDHKKYSDPLPNPPIFQVSGLKYTVPPYYGYLHSETQWLINMLKSDNWDRIFRVITANPDYLKNTYCQYADSPKFGSPMFHRKAVLYLTPLGLAIYLLKNRMVQRILFFISQFDGEYDLVNQPCFVTNYLERFKNRNDLMMIYPFCIMIRRENYEAIPHLLTYGWKPQNKVLIPYKRIFQIYTFHYKDVIEYTIAQMALRPNIQLCKLFEKLLQSCDNKFDIYLFEKMSFKCDFNSEKIDYVSIPRRLLRYLQYYDKDLLLLSQIMLAVKTIQRFSFFVGPRYFFWDCTFDSKMSDDPVSKVCNDQDNIISLVMSIIDLVEIRGHAQAKEKLLELLSYILIDTKWFVKFLITQNKMLVDYFTNLNEKMQPIKYSTIDSIRNKLSLQLDEISEVNMKNIREIYNPSCPKNYWKNNLNLYIEKNQDKIDLSGVSRSKTIPDPNNQKTTEILKPIGTKPPSQFKDRQSAKEITMKSHKMAVGKTTNKSNPSHLKESHKSGEISFLTDKMASLHNKDKSLKHKSAKLSEEKTKLSNPSTKDVISNDDDDVLSIEVTKVTPTEIPSLFINGQDSKETPMKPTKLITEKNTQTSRLMKSHKSSRNLIPTEKIDSLNIKDDQGLNFDSIILSSEKYVEIANATISKELLPDDDHLQNMKSDETINKNLKRNFSLPKNNRSQQYLSPNEMKPSLSKHSKGSKKPDHVRFGIDKIDEKSESTRVSSVKQDSNDSLKNNNRKDTESVTLTYTTKDSIFKQSSSYRIEETENNFKIPSIKSTTKYVESESNIEVKNNDKIRLHNKYPLKSYLNFKEQTGYQNSGKLIYFNLKYIE